jgi:hypothetical protein
MVRRLIAISHAYQIHCPSPASRPKPDGVSRKTSLNGLGSDQSVLSINVEVAQGDPCGLPNK